MKKLIIFLFSVFLSVGSLSAQLTPAQERTQLRAKLGEASAQCSLGLNYEYGRGGVPQDYTQAMKWYRLAADQGDRAGQYGVGGLYYDGRGVPQDYTQAMKWFRLAAGQGYENAQYSLGVMYENGFGVPKDDAKAMKWYRLAADQGNAKAQYNLGVAYDNGRGVPRDYVQAHMWFNLAATKGYYSNGAKNRDLVAKKMTPQQIAQAEKLARIWIPKRKHY